MITYKEWTIIHQDKIANCLECYKRYAEKSEEFQWFPLIIFYNSKTSSWLCLKHFLEICPEFKKSKQYKDIIAELL